MTDEHRVLVIDDDRSIQRLLTLALRGEGYEVRVAVNGQDALDVLKEWQPDLILLDLMMPLMDGRTFRAEQLRLQLWSDTPFVVLTASRNIGGAVEELGAAALVSKPFELDDLLDMVERCVASG